MTVPESAVLPIAILACVAVATIVILLLQRRRAIAAERAARIALWDATNDAQNARQERHGYRRALSFYAGDASWMPDAPKRHSPAVKDRGRVAREALVKGSA